MRHKPSGTKRESMGTCSRCGDAVDFRIFNGRCVPIHQSGGCAAFGGGVTHRGRCEASESACFLTRCPEGCGVNVYFIRYNGGCVWVDTPLGYPWYKHACMYPENVGAGINLTLDGSIANNDPSSSSNLMLAVVKIVEFSASISELMLIAGAEGEWHCNIKTDCRFLAGELVIVDLVRVLLFPFHRRDLRFRIFRLHQVN